MSWSTDYLDNLYKNRVDRLPVHLVGYTKVKEQLAPFMGQEKFPNLLITGEPGVGKTHLALWLGAQTGKGVDKYLAPANKIYRNTGGLILLDECHLQRKPEPLFQLMEEGNFLGATTRPEALDAAFASRFFLRIHLDGLTDKEMLEFFQRFASEASQNAQKIFAKASAGNPRQALRIIETAKGMNTWEPEKVLSTVQITVNGLTNLHLKYLTTLTDMTRPTGLPTISTLMGVDRQTISNLERLLLKLKMVELLPNGRHLTPLGRKYIETWRKN